MSNPMAQRIIRNVLLSCYGETRELRFFMRPDNRFAQYLVARQVLRHYAAIDDEYEVHPGGRADLFRAIASGIDEELEVYSQDAINNKIRHLKAHGPHPRHQPQFLRNLFSVNISVNE